MPLLKNAQERTGIRLLWGTANCFGNPRFMHGAGTSCNADAFAYVAAKIAKAIDVTKELGGTGYTFWGGREGYKSLLNTDMKRELDHLARLLHMAVDYKEKIGFKGQFFIEPKPKEPTKHQYDSDAAACHAFLCQHGLVDHFKLNLEASGAIGSVVDFLVSSHVPPQVLVFLLPMLVGFTTGVTMPTVAITYPFLIAFIGTGAEVKMGLETLAFSGLLFGLWLTPVHLCITLSASYFETSLLKIISKLILPAIGVAVAGALLAVFFG